jgi:outer membrane lipoprotein-sorting protein
MMIKKIAITLAILLAIGFGVWKIFFGGETIKDKIENISENLNSYSIEGNMEILNGEEKRVFNVKVDYLKSEEDLFKVSLYDTSINQEQILLRNKEGVYVLTPNLNKAHKFKSGWPLNSAKPYIYQSLLSVFDGDYELKKVEDGIIVESKLSYKHSPLYTRQEIKFSNEMVPVWVNIYNDKDEVVLRINFTRVEKDVSFEEDYFDLNKSMNMSRENISEDVVSPMEDLPYMLTGSDLNIELVDSVVVNIEDENMHMLVYSGDSNFTVIEKVSNVCEELEVIETNGEIVMTINGFVILQEDKVSYTYNGIEIIIYGDSLDVATYLNIANGMEVSASK